MCGEYNQNIFSTHTEALHRDLTGIKHSNRAVKVIRVSNTPPLSQALWRIKCLKPQHNLELRIEDAAKSF